MVSYGLASGGLKASAYEDSGLVLATRKGTPLDTQNNFDRHFKSLRKSAGLPSFRLESLQHTCFTILIARGTHLNTSSTSRDTPLFTAPLIATPTE
jgi:integrase